VVGWGAEGFDMRRGEWARDPQTLSRESRGGAITVAKLLQLGVPSRTVYRRCAPGGPWQLPLPGVVLLGSAEPTRRQLIDAALLYGGPHTVVTGSEACRQLGLRCPPDGPRVHLLVPEDRQVKSSDYVVVERTTRLPVPVVRSGFPLAPLVRAVLDQCRRLRAAEPIGALITEAVQRGRVNPHHLRRELDEGSPRGTALPREVLGKVLNGARSVAEIDALAVWAHWSPRSGLELRTARCRGPVRRDSRCLVRRSGDGLGNRLLRFPLREGELRPHAQPQRPLHLGGRARRPDTSDAPSH
jgi:hypothetical protein